jgi:gliding motility-associated lipoprotein GldH
MINMSPKHIFRPLLCGALLLLTLSGCIQSPHYQKSVSIPGNKWKNTFQPSFSFNVEDTTVMYTMYFLIRHTNTYAYSNIWMWVYTKQPGDTAFTKTRLEIPLSDASGRWFGNGMGEIWEQRMSITRSDDPGILSKKGHYEIRFEQNMRDRSLADVLQVGLRVEKGHKRALMQQPPPAAQ